MALDLHYSMNDLSVSNTNPSGPTVSPNNLFLKPPHKRSKLALLACGLVLAAAALFPVVPKLSHGGSNLGAAIQFMLTAYAAAAILGVASILTVISLILAWRGRCGWYWPRCAFAFCLALPIGFYTALWWPTQTRMVLAAGDGRERYVEFALWMGCDINAPREFGLGFNPSSAPPVQGETALTMAVLHRRDNMVRFLLAKGADANRADGNHETPLHLAERIFEYSIVELLVQNGAATRNELDSMGRARDEKAGVIHLYTDQEAENFRARLDTLEYPITPPCSCAMLGVDPLRLTDRSKVVPNESTSRVVWIHAGLSENYGISFHIRIDPTAADLCDKVIIQRRIHVSEIHKKDDKVEISIHDDTLFVDAKSPSGIGGARLVLPGGTWPKKLVVRLKYSTDKPFTNLEGSGATLETTGTKTGERSQQLSVRRFDKKDGFDAEIPPTEMKVLYLHWVDAYRN